MWLPPSLIVLAAVTVSARWNDPDAFPDGSDLEHFVTRPDIAAPRYIVTKHIPEAITEGYWFVSPYSSIFNRYPPGFRKEHVPCQTGAHIYDNDGVLVWSGACKYTNRNAYGFRPVTINGSQFLSFYQAGEDVDDGNPKNESNVLLNENYEEVRRISNASRGGLDMHEFNIQPGGKTAIITINNIQAVHVEEPRVLDRQIINPGFLEVDLATDETLFDWNGLDQGVSLTESWDLKGKNNTGTLWDAFHINSVDKDSDGDYYVSLRHACTIYKISKVDGSIKWRLGGSGSDYKMDEGVAFKWQHHIRVRHHNATHTILSLFDNSSEDEGRALDQLEQETSIGKIILLDNTAKRASILRSFVRPDKGKSEKLGSLQVLGLDGPFGDFETIRRSGVFINWANQGYVSEYDADNRLVMEAHFGSDRMKSYRGYKYKFVGKPKDRPTVKILPLGYTADGHDTASAFYVSWNGATEVVSWVFYGSDNENGPFQKLGVVRKTGFETSWVVPGRVRWGFAAAINRNGAAMKNSLLVPLESATNRNFAIPPSDPPLAIASDGPPVSPIPPLFKKRIPKVTVGPPKQPGEPAFLHSQQLPESQTPSQFQTSSSSRIDMTTNNTLIDSLVHLAIYGFAMFGFFCTARTTLLPVLGKYWVRRKTKRGWQSKDGSEVMERALLTQSMETWDESEEIRRRVDSHSRGG